MMAPEFVYAERGKEATGSRKSKSVYIKTENWRQADQI
jgi:hypothetical protein